MAHRPTTITENKGLWGGKLMYFESISSTNSWVLDNPGQCHHGDLIVAGDQTEGRGRFERKWISLPGKSVTVSFVINAERFPHLAQEHYAQIAAFAVWQLLSELKIQAQLKWPNDIVTKNGKICGILAEHVADSRIVVGAGINTSIEPLHIECDSRCTSIQAETECAPTNEVLVAKLTNYLERAFTGCENDGMAAMRAEWAAHDHLKARQICITTPTGKLTGIYLGINEGGQLLIEIAGDTRAFSAGDVTLAS